MSYNRRIAKRKVSNLVAPTDGQVLAFNAGIGRWAPADAAQGGGSGYTKYSFTYLDFATGHGGDGNFELLVATIPALTNLDDVKINMTEFWSELGGDGVQLYLTIDTSGALVDSVYMHGEREPNFPRVDQAAIDATHRRFKDTPMELRALINVAADAAHTLSELDSGAFDIYVKTTSMEG